MVDKNTSSLLWMGTTGWPCLLGYFALFSTASRRSARSWRSVLLRMRRRSGTYGKVVVLHWDQFFGVGGKPGKQNTWSLGFFKFSAPGPGAKNSPIWTNLCTRSMLTPLQSWWSLDEKPKSTAISSWSLRRFSKGDDGLGVNHGNPKQVARNPLFVFCLGWNCFLQFKMQHFDFAVWTYRVGEPCTCSCFFRGQASFCRSHCGNH